MNILLSGGAGFRNAGDEALLRAAVQACHLASPSASLSYLANGPEVAARTLAGFDVGFVPSPRFTFFRGDHHYDLADDTFRNRWNRIRHALLGKTAAEMLTAVETSPSLDFVDRPAALATVQAIISCDALVVHGGGILTSYTRSRLWEQSLTVEIAGSLGKRVLLRSHQIGPITDCDDEDRLRAILTLAGYVSTRDKQQSALEVARVAPFAHVVDQVDDALTLEMDEGDGSALDTHALSPGGYICVGYRHNPGVGVDETAYAKTALIVSAARRHYDLPIVLLPQGPFDEPSLATLATHLDFPTQLIPASDDLSHPISIASNAQLMIACPHHSLIFALRGGVQVLSPVMGSYYAFKNIGSMRFFGMEDQVFSIDGPPETFASIVNERLASLRQEVSGARDGLRRRVAELRRLAHEQDREFGRVLTGSA